VDEPNSVMAVILAPEISIDIPVH